MVGKTRTKKSSPKKNSTGDTKGKKSKEITGIPETTTWNGITTFTTPLSPTLSKWSLTLTPPQQTMLRGMTWHLFFQMVLLVSVVVLGHYLFSNRICLFSCRLWVDLVVYILLAVLLLMVNFVFFREASNPTHIFFANRGLLWYRIIAELRDAAHL